MIWRRSNLEDGEEGLHLTPSSNVRSFWVCRGAISNAAEQGCPALEQSKEENIVEVELKYSLGWPELKGDEVLALPPAGGLEPSDCHLAVFLDDIGM